VPGELAYQVAARRPHREHGVELDGTLGEGFLGRARHNSLRLKQKLASVADRYPAVVAEIRGEGLMLGLRTLVPLSDFIGALREEKLLAVPAGESVARLLGPLL